MNKSIELIVLDVDNTLFDWVNYYTPAMEGLLARVSEVTGIDVAQLTAEAKTVFSDLGSIEHPFLIQRLPSVLKHYDQDEQKILSEVVAPGRDAFLETASKYLSAYPTVIEGLEALKNKIGAPVVALTDAPRYVAMWKMNKLNMLSYFDSVYGLADPTPPKTKCGNKLLVDTEIAKKHLTGYSFGFKGHFRVLPNHFEKPNPEGFKMILDQYKVKDPKNVVWVGDNLKKDMLLGNKLGVQSFWAKYGVLEDAGLYARLAKFSPEENIAKHSSTDTVYSKADLKYKTLNRFVELMDYLT